LGLFVARKADADLNIAAAGIWLLQKYRTKGPGRQNCRPGPTGRSLRNPAGSTAAHGRKAASRPLPYEEGASARVGRRKAGPGNETDLAGGFMTIRARKKTTFRGLGSVMARIVFFILAALR